MYRFRCFVAFYFIILFWVTILSQPLTQYVSSGTSAGSSTHTVGSYPAIVTISITGADGYSLLNSGGCTGGKGGRVQVTLAYVEPGTEFTINLGEEGDYGTNNNGYSGGGNNGGGNAFKKGFRLNGKK